MHTKALAGTSTSQLVDEVVSYLKQPFSELHGDSAYEAVLLVVALAEHNRPQATSKLTCQWEEIQPLLLAKGISVPLVEDFLALALHWGSVRAECMGLYQTAKDTIDTCLTLVDKSPSIMICKNNLALRAMNLCVRIAPDSLLHYKEMLMTPSTPFD